MIRYLQHNQKAIIPNKQNVLTNQQTTINSVEKGTNRRFTREMKWSINMKKYSPSLTMFKMQYSPLSSWPRRTRLITGGVTKRKPRTPSLPRAFTGSVKWYRDTFVGTCGSIYPLGCFFVPKIPPQRTYPEEIGPQVHNIMYQKSSLHTGRKLVALQMSTSGRGDKGTKGSSSGQHPAVGAHTLPPLLQPESALRGLWSGHTVSWALGHHRGCVHTTAPYTHALKRKSCDVKKKKGKELQKNSYHGAILIFN